MDLLNPRSQPAAKAARSTAPCPAPPEAALQLSGPALVAAALALKHAAPAQALRGRHVAVLSETLADGAGEVFSNAARALGAVVVHIRPSSLLLATPRSQRHTAHALGRLYAALSCAGVAAAALGALQRWSGVPVFGDLAAPSHPSWALAAQMAAREQAQLPATPGAARGQQPAAALHDHHRYLIQAWLAHCVMSA